MPGVPDTSPPRSAGAILVIARIRLTAIIRANTAVGAKHPIPAVAQRHWGTVDATPLPIGVAA